MDFLATVQEIFKQAAPQQAAPQSSTPKQESAPAQSAPTAFEAASAPMVDVSPTSFSTSPDESIYTQPDTPTMNGFENTKGLSKEEINEKDRAWRDEKEAMGLKTTNINYQYGETTFAEYFAALDPEVQKMLTSYFEEGAANKAEAEKAISEIAGIFQNTNVVKNQTFVNAVRALGYDVEWGSVETDYIIDFKNKKAGGGSLRKDGHITMLTIKNKDGEELFKMVDANGNGSIEMEELFFNEFLTGISSQIDKELMVSGLKAIQSVGYGSEVDVDTTAQQSGNDASDSNSSGNNADGKSAITIGQIKQLLNSKTEAGKSVEQAAAEIKMSYDIDEKGEKFIKDYQSKAAKNEDTEPVEQEEDKDEVEVTIAQDEETVIEEENDELLEAA